jgi:hypothetical protein
MSKSYRIRMEGVPFVDALLGVHDDWIWTTIINKCSSVVCSAGGVTGLSYLGWMKSGSKKVGYISVRAKCPTQRSKIV